MNLIDLTQTFTDSMPVYPGDDRPEIKQTTSIANEGINHSSLRSGMHVGTHIDAPLHFLENGKKISEIPPQQFFGRGRLIDARGELTIHAGLLDKVDLKTNDIVLVLTGLNKLYKTPQYFKKYPEVTGDFAQKLIDKGISLIGLDSCSPDKEPYDIHKILLGNDVLIIENLTNLELLIDTQFTVIALPIKIDAESGLARVIAGVET